MDDLLLSLEESKTQQLNILGKTIVSDILNNQTHVATEKIVEFIKKYYTFKSIRNDNGVEMWVYQNGIYIENGISYVREICRELFGDKHSIKYANQIIYKLKSDSLVDHNEFFNMQSEFPHLLPVENGILNLNTKQVEDFTPDIIFFTKLRYKYNPDAICNDIQKFIRSIVKTDLDLLTIQEIIGFTLLREYEWEKGFMFYGEHGRNGKSKLLSLIQKLLGSNNCSSVALQDLETDQFCLINLHNKLVNIAADLSNQAMDNTGKYKQLTGRDEVTANRKNKTHIQFKNYAKMIFACNELPIIKTITKAFWLRWVVIDFPYRFLPQNELNALEDKTGAFLQDPNIINKISCDDEMEGLLVWAVEGYQRLKDKGSFSNEKTASTIEKFWGRKSNSVKAFIDDMIEYSYDSKVTKEEFRKEYHEYCKRFNIPQMSERLIKTTLENQLGIETKKIFIKTDEGSSQFRVWQGIKFKDVGLLKFHPDRILEFVAGSEKGVKFSALQTMFDDVDNIFEQVKLLEREGSIIEMPVGVWRLPR